MQALWTALRNVVSRARVDRPGAAPQVAWLGGRVAPAVEHLQGPGVFFVAPAGASGALLAPAGDPSVAMVVGLDGARPAAGEAGEGGLHYLGTWKVFVDKDGSVHLGKQDPADFVALASPIDTLFQDLATAINGWSPVATDGGAALKTALAAWLAQASVANVGSSTVKAE